MKNTLLLVPTVFKKVETYVKNEEHFFTPLIKNGEYYSILDNDTFIGIVALKQLENNIIFLDKIGILPEYRKLKYGRQVLNIVKELYEKKKIRLKCFNEKLVKKFYIKNDFKVISEGYENNKYWLMEKDNVTY